MSAAASYAGAKLYYTPTSCGAASFITAHAAGLHGLHVEQVDLKTHVTKSGKDFYTVNAKGNVPTLVLADGTVLNEGASILQFLADQKPSANLVPAAGTVERYRLLNALNHVASEVHPRIGALFSVPDSVKEFFVQRATQKLLYLEKELTGKKFYVGDHFTIVDAYLYVVLNWTQWVNLNLDTYPTVKSYYEGIKALPIVQEAHKAMEKNPEKLE